MAVSWINGEVRDSEGAVSVLDRGFLLGDGAFETLLFESQSLRFTNYHLERLNAGLDSLCIKCVFSEKMLQDIVGALLGKLSLVDSGVLRITVTRGDGGRGLSITPGVSPNIIATMSEVSPTPPKTKIVMLSDFERPPGRFSHFKSIGGYQTNIVARLQAEMAGADEVLLLGCDGKVICTSSANIFAVDKAGNILTPPVEHGALPGVIRRIILENCNRENIPILFESIDPETLFDVGLVATNSIIGVQQVAMKDALPLSQRQNDRIHQLKRIYEDAVISDRGAEFVR